MLHIWDQLKASLRGNFQPVVNPNAQEPHSRTALDLDHVINFVWMRNSPQTKNDKSPPLPDKYTQNIIQTARENPDCSVMLWADAHHWNAESWKIITDLCAQSEMPNLSLQSLNAIPEYNSNKIFSKTRKGFYDHTDPIWQKVDFARIIVLAHVLETTDAKQAYYADLDLKAPKITSPEVQSIMSNHGMVFALNNRAPDFLENQFMGFNRENSDFVVRQLVPMTRHAVTHGTDGWLAMCQAAHDRLGTGKNWLNGVTVNTIEIH